MSHLVDHARHELELSGETTEDPRFTASILAAVEAFASYDGHSGASHFAAVDMLGRLLRLEPLGPLTSSPDEWLEVGPSVWQNRRDSRAFSTDGGKTWKVNA